MQIVCPKCGFAVSAADVNVALGVAKCTTCNDLFSIGEQVAQPPPLPVSATRITPGSRSDAAAADVTRPPKPLAPQPSYCRVEDLGEDIVIRKRWFSPIVFFLIPFCIAWNGFLIGWYAMFIGLGFGGGPGFGPGGGMPFPIQLIFLLFPMGHIAVGVGLAYTVLTMLFNTTVIALQGDELSVRHGPLPWLGNITLNASEVTQLYCTEMFRARRNSAQVGSTYSLFAVLTDRTQRPLLKHQTQADFVWYVEWVLEEKLKIVDQPVAGEMSW